MGVYCGEITNVPMCIWMPIIKSKMLMDGTGQSWSRLRLTVSSSRDAARTWPKRTGGYRRKFRSWGPSNCPRSSTCRWPHPPPSPCALHVSVLRPRLLPPPPAHNQCRWTALGPTRWATSTPVPSPSTPSTCGPPPARLTPSPDVRWFPRSIAITSSDLGPNGHLNNLNRNLSIYIMG